MSSPNTRYRPLEIGKLPPELLTDLIADTGASDPQVILGPALGEDCAIVRLGDRHLLAKSDPVTFAAARIGWYAVQVNANDIACAGSCPPSCCPFLTPRTTPAASSPTSPPPAASWTSPSSAAIPK